MLQSKIIQNENSKQIRGRSKSPTKQSDLIQINVKSRSPNSIHRRLSNSYDEDFSVTKYIKKIENEHKKIQIIDKGESNGFNLPNLIQKQLKQEHNVNFKHLTNLTQQWQGQMQDIQNTMNLEQFIDLQNERFSNIMKLMNENIFENPVVRSKFHDPSNSIKNELQSIIQNNKSFLNLWWVSCQHNQSAQIKQLNSQKEIQKQFMNEIFNYINNQKNGMKVSSDDKTQFLQNIYQLKINLNKEDVDMMQTVLEMFENDLRTINELTMGNDLLKNENQQLIDDKNSQNQSQKSMNEKLIEQRTNQLQFLHERNQKLIKFMIGESEQVLLVRQNEEYKKQVQDLMKELSTTQSNLKECENVNKKLVNRLKNYGKSLKDKEIQCDFGHAPVKEVRIIPFFQYFKQLRSIQDGQLIEKEPLIMIINSILSDKIICDFNDRFSGKTLTPFYKYVVQWFLIKFGSKKFAEQMFKDFIFSLEKFKNVTRIKLIQDLMDCRQNEKDEIEDTDYEINIQFKSIQQNFLGSVDGFNQFIRIIEKIKYFQDKHVQKEHENYQFFLPNIFIQGKDLIQINVAIQVCKEILGENDFTKQQILILENNFKNVIQSDMYYRLSEEKNNVYFQKPIDHEDQFIRFDFLIQFLLEYLIEKKVDVFNKFRAQLFIDQNHHKMNYLQFDKYQQIFNTHYESSRYAQETYYKLMTCSSQSPHLQNRILLILQNFTVNPKSRQQLNFEFLKILDSYGHLIYFIPFKQLYLIMYLFKGNFKKSQLNSKDDFINIMKQVSKDHVDNEKIQEVVKKFSIKHYDHLSQLSTLQTTFGLIQIHNESQQKLGLEIQKLIKQMQNELVMYPQNIYKLSNNKLFEEYEPETFMNSIENLWLLLRKIIEHMFKSKVRK